MATKYILSGGEGDGSAWNNALAALPVPLVRGDNYYIGGGTYDAYSTGYDGLPSGTTTITIKKATIADHGDSIGWQDSYGTTQAVFTDHFHIFAGNVTIDGQTRNESNWFDVDAYGIKIGPNTSGEWSYTTMKIGDWYYETQNVQLRYVAVLATEDVPTDETVSAYPFSLAHNVPGRRIEGFVCHRMLVGGGTQGWFLRGTGGAIVEYSACSGHTSNNNNHGNTFNAYYLSKGPIIRYNHTKNTTGTSVVSTAQSGSVSGGEVYGNVFENYAVGNGVVGFGELEYNWKVYNNTFIKSTLYNGGIKFSGTGNVAYNNLWVGYTSTIAFEGVTHDYNSFSGASAFDEAHGVADVPTTIFTDYDNGDYTLATATDDGTTLPSPYNTDRTGAVRGNDNVWDRGAYEFDSGATPIGEKLVMVLA